ncbi:hypothetical protein, partial [Sphingomonas sp. ERG5]|uniref:hypothetical protein n=1 Tax=Sphingomonas sp. ERG5 TaxID=1381597 RepID=UPI001F3D268D
IGSVHHRPAPTDIEIPIEHRLRPAGSGTEDFPTPGGVRNSQRKRTVHFQAPKTHIGLSTS